MDHPGQARTGEDTAGRVVDADDAPGGLVGLDGGPAAARLGRDAPGMLSEPDAARRLGVHPKTLARRRAARAIRFYRFGRTVRYDERDLEAYSAGLVVEPLEQPDRSGGVRRGERRAS